MFEFLWKGWDAWAKAGEEVGFLWAGLEAGRTAPTEGEGPGAGFLCVGSAPGRTVTEPRAGGGEIWEGEIWEGDFWDWNVERRERPLVP